MSMIPVKVRARLSSGVKKYKPILTKARNQDINESDTVTIINDMLSDIFGYEKFVEITSEYAIKKTFCDLAVKLNGDVKLLIEAKAAGMNLKDNHIKQAVDYGANEGIEWVVLTNGTIWEVYKIIFGKPISHELVYSFDMSTIDIKNDNELELLFLLSRESINKVNKDSLEEFHHQKQIVNRFTIGQVLLSDPVLDATRKTLKKMAPDAKISNEEVKEIIFSEIIKREVLDDEKAIAAKKKVTKALKPAVKKTV